MPEWMVIIVALAVFVVLPLFIPFIWWRLGMKTDYFFEYEFWLHFLGVPTIAVVVVLVGDLLKGKQTEYLAMPTILLGYELIFLFFYTAGFVHGRFKRRKAEGIIRS
ncbi:hypothetical protein [Altererythrobacter lutimaris]|uniref:Uncharacterized protein n=1 Tax=Altererythrobacter lutimaris TaxID=2743979 RepID=A0A850HIK0_9SPHN|nr:hypothetical protein [Altererythrobacter lutimaris]NVE95452.1 hypothetical protein [Altererythrobacter lutimaris]